MSSPAAAEMVSLDAIHPWEGNPRDNTEGVDNYGMVLNDHYSEEA